MNCFFNKIVIKENRIGKVIISDEVVENNLKLLMDKFLSKIFIVEVVNNNLHRYECIGYSELFDSISESTLVPIYNLVFEKDKFVGVKKVE